MPKTTMVTHLAIIYWDTMTQLKDNSEAQQFAVRLIAAFTAAEGCPSLRMSIFYEPLLSFTLPQGNHSTRN